MLGESFFSFLRYNSFSPFLPSFPKRDFFPPPPPFSLFLFFVPPAKKVKEVWRKMGKGEGEEEEEEEVGRRMIWQMTPALAPMTVK